MTEVEIIESSFKTLRHRTDEAMETIETVNRQCTKTSTGLHTIFDQIRDMREKLRAVMNRQDDIAFQCKGIDKIMSGTSDVGGGYAVAKDTIQVPRRKKDQEEDDEFVPEPVASKKAAVFDELSDDELSVEPTTTTTTTTTTTMREEEPHVPTTDSDSLADKPSDSLSPPYDEEDDSASIDMEAERQAALELANRLDAEFEADEAALRVTDLDQEAGGEPEKPAVEAVEDAKDAEAEIVVEGGAEEEGMSEEEARRIAEIELKRLAEEDALLQEEEEELRRLEEEERMLREEEELRAEEEELRKLEEEALALEANN